jgi:hypothetical protein
VKCSLCRSEKLRVSRLHLTDLTRLLLFSHPVRCTACYERMFLSLFAAFKIHRKAVARKQAASEGHHSEPQTRANGA